MTPQRPRHGSLSASITLLAALFIGLGPAPGCNQSDAPEVVELVRADGVDQEVIELIELQVGRVREKPRDRERRARLAMAYEANELWDEARRSWEGALALGADDPLWRYHLSICTRQSGDNEGALRELRAVVAARADLAPARHRLGDMLLEKGDVAGARTEFETAIDLEPNQPNAYVGLAETLLREEQFERARTLCEQALAMASDYKRAHYSLGLAYRGLGRREEAQKHMNMGLNAKKDYMSDPLGPDVEGYKRSYIVRVQEAGSYEKAGKPQQAILILEDVIKKHPEDLAVVNNLAAVYMQVDRLPEAFALLERALQLDANKFSTYTNLATAELARGNAVKALEYAERAVEFSETVGHAYFTRARALLGLRRTSEAYRDLNKAVELDSTQWMPYAYLGDVAIELQLYDLAVDHFADAIRMKPDHLPAHTRMSWALNKLGRQPEALAAYERARAVAPQDPQIAVLARELGIEAR